MLEPMLETVPAKVQKTLLARARSAIVSPPFRVGRCGGRTDRGGRDGPRGTRAGRGDGRAVDCDSGTGCCSCRVGHRGGCSVRPDGRGGDRIDRRIDRCDDRAGRRGE